ncbi:glycosyltransferase family protein [Angustibacter aerolatus]
MSTHHLVVGPPEHGVTRCGQAHADADLAAGAASGRTRVERAVDLPDLAWLPDLLQHEAAGHHVHAHVTDRLLGTDPHRAREVLQALAARVPLSVTLHDLPQPADGRWFDARRALAAAAVAGCRRVVVSSEHERRLLAACLPPGTDLSHVHVVPLPLDAHPAGPGRPPHHPVVGALGFVYPGKGHDDVLEALRGVEGAELLVLGRAAAGHDDLLDDLHQRAAAQGTALTVTGFVPDAELPQRLREVTVPVAANRNVSASGSVGTWLAAGRRPLVRRSGYAEELAERLPGCLWLVDDLVADLRRALADPSATWLPPGTRLHPTTAEAAALVAAALQDAA